MEVSRVICDRKTGARVEGKLYKTSETSYHVWFRDSSIDKKTGGSAKGGKAEDEF